MNLSRLGWFASAVAAGITVTVLLAPDSPPSQPTTPAATASPGVRPVTTSGPLPAPAPLPVPGQAGDGSGAAEVDPNCPFGGLWDSTYGRLVLDCEGERVVGSYSFSSGSTIDGTVANGRLTFRYVEPGARGEGWFELTAGGNAISGQWREDGSTAWQPWDGSRVGTDAGRRWLVVLEAYWETSLSDQEYAFGDMLRGWFSRYDHVEVRHRRLHDRADFDRAMAELAWLGGPTVVLLASHGTAGALTIGPDHITAADVAAALQSAPDVRLVHFSSCELATPGNLEAVRSALPADRDIAVSGYGVSVDWTASAILEMLYLDHILGRGLPAAEAARLIQQELAFSGRSAVPGSPLGAAQFRIVE